MIGFIQGKIEEISISHLIIENNGLGFIVNVPASVSETVSNGDFIRLYTHMSVREDDISLFGFRSSEDLMIYKLLIGVSGIGPKAGLSILSTLSSDQIKMAVMTHDAGMLAKAPGIGKKTAEKIVIELKDRFKPDDLLTGITGNAKESDNSLNGEAAQALISLGYTEREAVSALREAMQNTASDQTEDIIKAALRYL